MKTQLLSALFRMHRYYLWLLAIFISVILTEPIVIVMELLLKGQVSIDYLLTGLVAAILVAGVVVRLTSFAIEYTLQHSEIRYRALFDSSRDALITVSPRGFLSANAAAIKLFACKDEQELLTQSLASLSPDYQANGVLSKDLSKELMQQAYANGSVTFEWLHRRLNGEIFNAEVQLSRVNLVSEDILQSTVRDISQRKAFEQLQETARQEAEQLAQVKSEFLANISHEIRTPLNAVIGLAKIIVRDSQSGKLHENSVRIHEAGLHLLGLVNDILDFSKIEAGKMTLDLHPFKLLALVSEVVNLVELRATEKQLKLMVGSAEHLPEWVMGDAMRIRQILLNLLSNAIKFTEHGCITMAISRQNDEIEFLFIDTGIGISAEQISRLFTAFAQADSSTTRKFGGTGLGLAISRNLAQMMGGDISVKSSLGVGSQFILSLPLPETAAVSEQRITDQAVQARLQGLRILAAEDIALNRIVLDDILTQEGAQVVFAENGQQVLDRLTEFGFTEFDIVLMDIQMPVMDGYQATRLILQSFPSLPVIGLTAHAMPEERQRCLDAGMRARVTKPIDANSLVTTILQQLPAKTSVDNTNEVKQVSILEPENHNHLEIAFHPNLEAENLIDWIAMLQRYDGRQEFVNKLISSVLNGVHQENLQKLRLAAEQQDYELIKIIAHNIKGMAGVFDVQSLMNQAQRTELAAKNQQQQTTFLAMQLAEELQSLLTELQRYLAG